MALDYNTCIKKFCTTSDHACLATSLENRKNRPISGIYLYSNATTLIPSEARFLLAFYRAGLRRRCMASQWPHGFRIRLLTIRVCRCLTYTKARRTKSWIGVNHKTLVARAPTVSLESSEIRSVLQNFWLSESLISLQLYCIAL